MADDLDAGPVSLFELLQGEREYHSPLFQRRYVWTKHDLDRLWQDIYSVLEGIDSVRFLGALVVESRSKTLATDPTSYWIIDGQQRFTSLYLFLCNLAAAASFAHDESLVDEITRIYLLNQAGSVRNEPKLKPTLLDQRQMNSILKECLPSELKLPPTYGTETGRLATAHGLIKGYVRSYCRVEKKWNVERIRALLSAVLGNLRFVQIVLKDKTQVDPNQVFDSLNTTGQPLENKDLIRNEVFKTLSSTPEQAQSLYENRWIPFEERLAERLDGYFFPLTLIHEPTATKSAVLFTLRRKWQEAKLSPDAIIDDLESYVAYYDAMTSPAEDPRKKLGLDESVFKALTRLVSLGAPASILPFCMKTLAEVSAGRLTASDAAGSLALVESFLVRRAFLGLEPTGLHAVFKTLWGNCHGNPKRALEVIEKSQTIRFPADQEFAEAVRVEPLYRRTICSYVLREYELGLVGGDPPPPTVGTTADHVLPQKLNDDWKKVFSPEEHNQVVDTWANLVPLSGKVNSEKQRRNWEDVKAIFETETYFRTTKRLAKDHETWTSDNVRERADQLAAWALKRWPKLA